MGEYDYCSATYVNKLLIIRALWFKILRIFNKKRQIDFTPSAYNQIITTILLCQDSNIITWFVYLLKKYILGSPMEQHKIYH